MISSSLVALMPAVSIAMVTVLAPRAGTGLLAVSAVGAAGLLAGAGAGTGLLLTGAAG